MTGKLPNEEQREHYREHYSPGYGTELIRSYQIKSKFVCKFPQLDCAT
ncbi:hypothetical protein ABNF06_20055 [Paenibacillus larvae]